MTDDTASRTLSVEEEVSRLEAELRANGNPFVEPFRRACDALMRRYLAKGAEIERRRLDL